MGNFLCPKRKPPINGRTVTANTATGKDCTDNTYTVWKLQENAFVQVDAHRRCDTVLKHDEYHICFRDSTLNISHTKNTNLKDVLIEYLLTMKVVYIFDRIAMENIQRCTPSYTISDETRSQILESIHFPEDKHKHSGKYSVIYVNEKSIMFKDTAAKTYMVFALVNNAADALDCVAAYVAHMQFQRVEGLNLCLAGSTAIYDYDHERNTYTELHHDTKTGEYIYTKDNVLYVYSLKPAEVLCDYYKKMNIWLVSPQAPDTRLLGTYPADDTIKKTIHSMISSAVTEHRNIGDTITVDAISRTGVHSYKLIHADSDGLIFTNTSVYYICANNRAGAEKMWKIYTPGNSIGTHNAMNPVVAPKATSPGRVKVVRDRAPSNKAVSDCNMMLQMRTLQGDKLILTNLPDSHTEWQSAASNFDNWIVSTISDDTRIFGYTILQAMNKDNCKNNIIFGKNQSITKCTIVEPIESSNRSVTAEERTILNDIYNTDIGTVLEVQTDDPHTLIYADYYGAIFKTKDIVAQNYKIFAKNTSDIDRCIKNWRNNLKIYTNARPDGRQPDVYERYVFNEAITTSTFGDVYPTARINTRSNFKLVVTHKSGMRIEVCRFRDDTSTDNTKLLQYCGSFAYNNTPCR